MSGSRHSVLGPSQPTGALRRCSQHHTGSPLQEFLGSSLCFHYQERLCFHLKGIRKLVSDPLSLFALVARKLTVKSSQSLLM